VSPSAKARKKRALRPAGPAIVHAPREHGAQSRDLDRLHDVGVETRLTRTLAVRLEAVTRQRDQAYRIGVRTFANTPRDLVAVHDGQPDVEQHDVRIERVDLLERLRTAIG